MKIGYSFQFYDFRNDMRRIIAETAKNNTVVVFGGGEQAIGIKKHLPLEVEFRLVNERIGSLRNRFWEYFYLLFKKIPRSRQNFFLMAKFKISNLGLTGLRKLKANAIIAFQHFIPRLFSYDAYLNQLHFSSKTKIDDIDLFIFVTEIPDDYLLARLIKEKMNIKVYVYSWDHACKNSKFSRRLSYAVWNEQIGKDLNLLQDISLQHITIVGASQFGYVYEYLQIQLQPNPYGDYIYFGCAIGINELVNDELNIIKALAESLRKIKPSWKLIVRPYPVLRNWKYYDALRNECNVIVDTSFKTTDLSTTEEHILQKFQMISHARAFFHLGTTLGLEACFTNTPSFILDFGYKNRKRISLYNFIHQYQNKKYLIEPFPSNCLQNIKIFEEVIQQIDKDEYLEPNRIIPQQFPISSFTQFAERITASN